jgi:hypothetical protein
MIMDCDKDKMDQDIRIVCQTDQDTDSGCNHLFQNASPEGKIVRLPNDVSFIYIATELGIKLLEYSVARCRLLLWADTGFQTIRPFPSTFRRGLFAGLMLPLKFRP